MTLHTMHTCMYIRNKMKFWIFLKSDSNDGTLNNIIVRTDCADSFIKQFSNLNIYYSILEPIAFKKE